MCLHDWWYAGQWRFCPHCSKAERRRLPMRSLVIALALALCASGAQAQSTVKICAPIANPQGAVSCQDVPGVIGPGGVVMLGAALAPSNVEVTQSSVTLAAATTNTLIAANTARRYLCWMNAGTAPMTVVPVSTGTTPSTVTVVAGTGMNYDPGSSAINQGGGFCLENSSITKQAFRAISTAGTTAIVWEGQ